MPESPSKKPPRPPGPTGVAQQSPPGGQSQYNQLSAVDIDHHDDLQKPPGPIFIQPEKSPMLAQVHSPYQPTEVAMDAKDIFKNRWNHRRAQVYSLVQLVCSFILLILGIVATVVKPTLYHSGVGIWLGIFALILAASGLLSARYKTKEMVGIFLVLSMLVAFLSFIGLVIVTLGANTDVGYFNSAKMSDIHSMSGNGTNSNTGTLLNVYGNESSTQATKSILVTSTTAVPPPVEEHSISSKIATNVFLIIGVSTELIMALLSWFLCWQAVCFGSRQKKGCVNSVSEFCSDTFCFCCT